jgi:CheY-like chemotaxis protein
LIFLDIHLNQADGYQVCQALKNDSELKDIPFVFLTASTGVSIAKNAAAFRAGDYLIEADDLLAKIKKFIG